MLTRRVKVIIEIRTKNEADELTSAERWDIISSAANATRSAIEHYLEPAHRQKACDAVARVLRAPPRGKVSIRSVPVQE